VGLLLLLLAVEEERDDVSDPTRIDVVVILDTIERRCEFTGVDAILFLKKE
jgi:hypothetical protein